MVPSSATARAQVRMNPPHPATWQSAAPVHPRARQRPGKTAKAGPSWPNGQMRHLAYCQPAAAIRSRSVPTSHVRPARGPLRQSRPARPSPSGPPAVHRPAAPQLTPEQAVCSSIFGIAVDTSLPSSPARRYAVTSHSRAQPRDEGPGRLGGAAPGPSPQARAPGAGSGDCPRWEAMIPGPRTLPAHAMRLCWASQSGQRSAKTRPRFTQNMRKLSSR